MKAIQLGGRLMEGAPERLDDATKATLRAVINDATERTPEVMAAETRLEMDHDQAREDVKRLAAAIREAIRIGAVETPHTFELILREIGQ